MARPRTCALSIGLTQVRGQRLRRASRAGGATIIVGGRKESDGVPRRIVAHMGGSPVWAIPRSRRRHDLAETRREKPWDSPSK